MLKLDSFVARAEFAEEEEEEGRAGKGRRTAGRRGQVHHYLIGPFVYMNASCTIKKRCNTLKHNQIPAPMKHYGLKRGINKGNTRNNMKLLKSERES